MLFLPTDLFTPFIEGRESAIDRNFNDIARANRAQESFLRQDQQALDNLFSAETFGSRADLARSQADLGQARTQAAQGQNILFGETFGSKVEQARNGANLAAEQNEARRLANQQAALDFETQSLAQPGRNAVAQASSDYQLALADASRPNLSRTAQLEANTRLRQAEQRLLQAQNNADRASADAVLFPQVVQLQEAGVQSQLNQLQQPQPTTQLLPSNNISQPTIAGVVTPSDVRGVASALPIGQQNTSNINGQNVTYGRDNEGIYWLQDGNKLYIDRNQSPQMTNDIFSFGG